MIEIVLSLIGVVVVYFLYTTLQNYLKNPLRPQEAQKNTSPNKAMQTRHLLVLPEVAQKEKIKNSEYGILSAMLGVMARADGEACELEYILIEDMIDEMCKELRGQKITRDDLFELYNNPSTYSIEELCVRFRDATKGEYKKRLKIIEFLFVLAYADGVRSQAERELLLDIAAYLELDNEDFNRMYDTFENLYKDSLEMSLDEAKALFGLDSSFTKEDIKRIYAELAKLTKGNILDNKQIDKTLLQEQVAEKLRKLERAYRILSESLKSANLETSQEVKI